MAPKKTVAPEEGIASSESPNKDEKVSGKAKSESSKAPDVARKTHLHPPTMIMVKEALKELDSRKGVSSQAIRSYITEKYPSLDQVRLKYMMRKALNKGIESGVLARPPNSTASGAQGRFRLAVRGKLKEPKLKATENTDPNVAKASKAGAKKTKEKEAVSERRTTAKKEKTSEASFSFFLTIDIVHVVLVGKQFMYLGHNGYCSVWALSWQNVSSNQWVIVWQI
ncbi:unnamed protein product [Oncorhynchus mykiss]|uniref:H15 domain-containing protein n=1 Tax=Oncorhynchus mykiss TaxID=8022 RepID=A0A060X4Y9_ONCMY|nr:unnamed protein product [Oncorhynchus mykiss]